MSNQLIIEENNSHILKPYPYMAKSSDKFSLLTEPIIYENMSSFYPDLHHKYNNSPDCVSWRNSIPYKLSTFYKSFGNYNKRKNNINSKRCGTIIQSPLCPGKIVVVRGRISKKWSLPKRKNYEK